MCQGRGTGPGPPPPPVPQAAAPPADLRVPLTPGSAFESRAAGPSSPGLPFRGNTKRSTIHLSSLWVPRPRLSSEEEAQDREGLEVEAPPVCVPARAHKRALLEVVCAVSSWVDRALACLWLKKSGHFFLLFGLFAPGRKGPRTGSDEEEGIWGLKLRQQWYEQVGLEPLQRRVTLTGSANI